MFLKNRIGLYQHATLDTILVAIRDAKRCNYHAKVSRTEVLHKLCLDYNVLKCTQLSHTFQYVCKSHHGLFQGWTLPMKEIGSFS